MSLFFNNYFKFLFFFGAISLFNLIIHPPLSRADCPTTVTIKHVLQKVFPMEKSETVTIKHVLQKVFPTESLEIVKIEPAEIPGICRVQIKEGKQYRLLYTDLKGEFILAGNIFEAKSKKNLTRETTLSLNKLTTGDLLQLEALTGFSLGQGKKLVYFVTDPQCPFCKQAEPILKKLAGKEGVQVRYLLFPLASHKGAREQAISILCDKKGLEGWENGYKSNNQCTEGAKKVDETVSFLQKRGIVGTPTFIFSDGINILGMISEDELRTRLGTSKVNATTK